MCVCVYTMHSLQGKPLSGCVYIYIYLTVGTCTGHICWWVIRKVWETRPLAASTHGREWIVVYGQVGGCVYWRAEQANLVVQKAHFFYILSPSPLSLYLSLSLSLLSKGGCRTYCNVPVFAQRSIFQSDRMRALDRSRSPKMRCIHSCTTEAIEIKGTVHKVCALRQLPISSSWCTSMHAMMYGRKTICIGVFSIERRGCSCCDTSERERVSEWKRKRVWVSEGEEIEREGIYVSECVTLCVCR